MTVNRKDSCEARISDEMAGRLDDIAALFVIADVPDFEALHTLVETDARISAAYDELEIGHETDIEDVREYARERLAELPLGASSHVTFRVDLSTGGPADWLEIVCSGDGPSYSDETTEPYTIDRIVYHLADWFDHAERVLDGEQFEVAERFAREVVAELVD